MKVKGFLWFIGMVIIDLINTLLLLNIIQNCIFPIAEAMPKNVSIWQIIFLLSSIQTLWLLPALLIQKQELFYTNHLIMHIIRGSIYLIGISSTISAFSNYANNAPTVGDIVFSLTPIFVLLLAYFFTYTKVGWKSCLTILLGFVGVLIAENYHYPKLFKTNVVKDPLIFSSLSFALLDLINKKYTTKESILTMLLYLPIPAIILTIIPSSLTSITLNKYYWYQFIAWGLGENLLLFFALKAFRNISVTSLQPWRYLKFVFIKFIPYLLYNNFPRYQQFIGLFL